MIFMAQAVNVNFRLDAEVKKSMEAVCAELGLSLSAAFTIFAKKVSREKRIPFEESAGAAEYVPNAVTAQSILEGRVGEVTRYQDTQALFAALGS